MPSASAKSSARQAVVVHVHYEGKKAPKRSTRRRKTGATRGSGGESRPMAQGGGGGGPASSFSMPAQHGGAFYMHAPIPSVPRLVGESLGLGMPSSPFVNVKIEHPTVKEEVKTPGPAVKEEPSTPAPSRPTRPSRPVSLEVIGGEVEDPSLSTFLGSERERPGLVVLGGRQESLSHVTPSRDDHAVIGSLRARFGEVGGHGASGVDPGGEGDSEGGDAAAPPLPPAGPRAREVGEHGASGTYGVDAASPTMPQEGPQTRSKGKVPQDLVPMSARVYKAGRAQGRLLKDLQVLPDEEINGWFNGTNGGNFLARARKMKGLEGGRGDALPLPLADAIIKAHERLVGRGEASE